MDVLETIFQGFTTTLILTFASFAVGAVLAVVVALLRSVPFLPVRVVATVYVDVLRAVPPLVWLLIGFFGVGVLTPVTPIQAAIVTLSLVSSAYLSEIYRSGLRAVARGQWEAAEAVGLAPSRTLVLVIVPQMLRVIVAPTVTYLLGMLKDSALASVIGVQDITFYALRESQQTLQGLEVFTMTALTYIVISVPVALLGRWWAGRLVQGVQVR